MTTETAIRPEAIAGALTGLDLVVSPLLPMTPSPGEDARRIVRHGYAQARRDRGWACYFPDAAGDVGPKPGEPTRALRVGRTLMVDRELALELHDAARRRAERGQEETRRLARERRDLGVIAQMLGVPKVTAHREPDYFRTLYRAHLGSELDVWTGGPQVRIADDDLGPIVDDWRRRSYIAGRLRQAIVEWKLDEEEGGRGR